jgi:23S rRNA (guanosine2251-2'-O)-methyltransferase
MNDPHSYPHNRTFVIGVHSIRELLRHAPDRLLRLFTVKSKDSEIVTEFEKKKIPISYTSAAELDKMAGTDSHQSLIAQVKQREYLDAKQFLQEDRDTSFVLMLDQIFDPQNFGAIIRSAECFGADAIIWSKNRGSDITPIVTKTSCGASELIPLVRISNLAETAELFKKAGYEVVAAILDPTSESAFTFKYAPRTVLIVGSEGEGIQPLLRKKADRSIYLPMSGKVESLNVAQATAALLALKAKG